MANIHRQSVPYRFDAFCKKVLRNEAVDYLLQMRQQYQREMSFSDLSYSELQSLCYTEEYPSDSFTFTAHGSELRIDNEQVAEVFVELSPTEQSILILRFVMDMTDKEVGAVLECPARGVTAQDKDAGQDARQAENASAERRLAR